MNLYGWDTAFAIDVGVANDALARSSGELLVDFAIDDPDGLPIRAQGAFGGWQIAPGGSGQFVTLRLPVVEGWLELMTPGSRRVDLAGTSFVASVALDLVPSTLPDVQDLRFDVTSAGKVGQEPEPGVVTPIRMDDPAGRLDDIEEALLVAALADYVARHADRISFVFATVNLVPPQTDSWLTPVRSAFAYADRSSGGGALVILSVTTDREIGDLPRSIDPALLSPSYQAAFGFSAALLLEHVIMPTLPVVFGHGATAASFAYDAGAGQIVNLATLTMSSVRKGLIDYTPEIRTMRLGIDGASLRGKYTGWCDLKAGISMTFWVDPVNPIVYDDATKSLAFLADGSARSGYSADIPWWWWAAGPLVRLIVEIVVQAIAAGLADSLTSAAGSMLSPARNPPTSIRWQATQDLQIADARVDGDFVMRGDFAPMT